MFRARILTVLAAFGLAGPALACDLPATRPSFVDTAPRAGFDTARFADEVAEALGDRFMGYAVTLRARSGAVIAQVNRGYARTPCEDGGAKTFNGRTVSPIGSVSKALTAATVIHRAETLDSVSLDDPFRDYLPARWRPALHASLDPVTLRNLLEHRGGFAKSGKTLWGHEFTLEERYALGEESYLVRAQDIAKGSRTCVPAPVTRRCYANTSFALWNVSTASLTPRKWATIEAAYQPGEITYDSYLLVHAYRLYRETVEKVLFDPLDVSGGCNVYTDPMHRAFTYDGPDSERGTDRADPGRPCAIGGWFMSTRDLSAVIHRIATTREVIDANHDLMFSSGDDRLVFASRTRVADGFAVAHNGSRWGGDAKAEVIVFPNGYVAAAIANSSAGGAGPNLRGALVRGYDAAVTPTVRVPTPGDIGLARPTP
ncbi:serine hydrolase domain-containing protein [Rhodovulum marinum]|uniref:Beta-lactamase n=1 Tax=Rhodovulum marinum TaxID=320662 RepID=A0A4V2SRJ9_9RHOB|nr:serine hydrolase domain-containing protein [Rhodovulum marinum]TCP42896.1 beta-lactamase [Rhodovulum marinum]